jgi:phosphoribosyl 1,2-cyclic phosphate phosphodiesterase
MVADRLRFTVLGCGSSPGTPRIIGDWGDCDPANPKNRRLRAAAMFERIAGHGGVTRVVVDTGPDFREQMLAARVRRLDAVVYTHAHADHIHGIDDLRGYWLQQRRLIDVHADRETLDRLLAGFRYCFETPPGGNYPPILRANQIAPFHPFTVAGEGGDLVFEPLAQIHGDSVSLGLRVGPVAYCPDVSGFPPETVARLDGLGLLVIDALQYRSHPSHFSLREALAWIERLRPEQAVLTHMHTPLDYDRVMKETPVNVGPAHDGLALEFPIMEG